MTCEICKERAASVHLTQVIDGKVKKMHLCEQCAAKTGIDVNGPLSITDILLGMGMPKQAAEAAAAVVDSSGPERTCPRCHMRRSDFKKGGRFGCAECYEAFADELPPLLKQMHRSDHHTGKIPAGQGRKIQVSADLSALQARLKKAVSGERFEEAAKLRDEIEAAKAKLKTAEGAA
jgi:protein arginine kinase activator